MVDFSKVGEGLAKDYAKIKGFFVDEPIKVRAPDFSQFVFQEFISSEGTLQKSEEISLVGNQLPIQPFEFGGEQRRIKEYYPGNPEAIVQVLGPIDTDVVIRGRFYAKKLPRANTQMDLYRGPKALVDALDDMRSRGNIIQFTMGDWTRFGIIERTIFRMKSYGDIEYEITLGIVSKNAPPTRSPVLTDSKGIPIDERNLLVNQMTQFELDRQRNIFPTNVSLGVLDIVNSVLGDVAAAVNTVTGFFDGIISTAENIVQTLNHAQGIVKNARRSIYQSRLRLARLSYAASFAGLPVPDAYSASRILGLNSSHMTNFESTLAAMQVKFAGIKKTLPKSRHRVVQGDNLQRISMKYYNNDKNWKLIHDHNNLQDIPGLVQETSIVTVPDVAQSLNGKAFVLYDDFGSVAFWIDVNNQGTAPPALATSSTRAVEISTINANDTAAVVAQKITEAIDGDLKFSATLQSPNTVKAKGIHKFDNIAASSAGTSTFIVTTTQFAKALIPSTELQIGTILEIPKL